MGSALDRAHRIDIKTAKNKWKREMKPDVCYMQCMDPKMCAPLPLCVGVECALHTKLYADMNWYINIDTFNSCIAIQFVAGDGVAVCRCRRRHRHTIAQCELKTSYGDQENSAWILNTSTDYGV